MDKNKNKHAAHAANLHHATRVARNTLFIVAGLTILKGVGGYITNIVSLAGDAVGSFSDIIASTAIFIGLKLSERKANSTFKYGFHRIETFVSLIISCFIIVLGYSIARESIARFSSTATTTAHAFGIAAAAISIVVSIYAFTYSRATGEKINSQALIASAYDKRNDATVSFGVLMSIIADKFRVPYVDSVIGIGIAILILWSGFKYGKDAVLYLLDYWDNPEVTRQIRGIIEKSKIVTAIKNIRLRHAGTYIFGEAFLEVNPFTDSKDLRDEIHRLDREIEETVEHLGDLVLYIDPPKPTLVRVALPIVEEKGLQSKIAEDALQEFRLFFVEIKNGRIKKYYAREKMFTVKQTTELASALKEERANIVISSLITPLLYYNLRLNNIRVYPHFLEVKDVENTVKLLLLDI